MLRKGLRIFRLFYISVALFAVLALFLLFSEPRPVEEKADNSPESIIAQVDTDNYLLRARATELSAACMDKECVAHKLSIHIRDNEPLESIDKAVLFASYMGNLDIPAQIVFDEKSTVPYVLACGLDRGRIYYHMLTDSLSSPFYTDTARLAAGQTWTKIPVEAEERRVAMRIEATQAVELSIKSEDSCIANDLLIMQTCNVKPNQLLSIFAAQETQISVALAYIDIIEQDIPIIVYKGRNCLPFYF